MPFMRRPVLVSENFFVRHSPFFILVLGGVILNSIFFVNQDYLALPIIIIACGMMILSFLLPYIFNREGRDKTPL